MKMVLKVRLILSYILLSILLIFSFWLVCNVFLKNQFQNYVKEKQEQKNLNYVKFILDEFDKGKRPANEFLIALGQNALNDGIILTLVDELGNEIFCMSCYDYLGCKNMLNGMEKVMYQQHPDFKGEYVEKTYLLSKDDENYGMVKVGFYGPFFYNDEDVKFIKILNDLFIKVFFVFIFIAIFTGYIMAIRISKPIKAVIVKTRKIETGDYNDRIDFKTNTVEIDGLIDSVNALAMTLQVQQNLKKRMADDYAHEFRTPLAAIQSNLEGIIDGIFEPTKERLESIRIEILRLSRMVSEIDKITELENNNVITLQKEKFNLLILLKQSLSTFETAIKEKELTICVSNLLDSPCEIFADKDKINRVIINLISNAIKYTDNQGRINISIEDKNEYIIFSIMDNGIGIDKSDYPHIFEHLYRADISRTRDTGGLGIGLSLVRAIISAHGGTINVNSKLGKGSEFIITMKKQ